ncbi:hypothetical protein [Dyella sp. 2RAB6]|uniref:hypothetical protein n=1 Tax=Dyella sp. 2RAB6 TaxID=3232992 RepID=UPI003F8F5DE4
MHRRDDSVRALRIACPNFSAEELGALRSILGLLKPYLKHAWVVDAAVLEAALPIDVCLINVDHPGAPAVPPGNLRVIGCSSRPRNHPRGTLHRPLRPPQILALLSEAGSRVLGERQYADATPSLEWSYRLTAWPRDLGDWPKSWWRVLASISAGALPLPRIAERTELPSRYVELCIERLRAAGLVERVPRVREAAAAPTSVIQEQGERRRWSGLAGRILHRFGLGK